MCHNTDSSGSPQARLSKRRFSLAICTFQKRGVQARKTDGGEYGMFTRRFRTTNPDEHVKNFRRSNHLPEKTVYSAERFVSERGMVW